MFPFDEKELKDIVVLLWGALLAALAWVARTLLVGRRMTLLQGIGGVLGAAVASFSFGALSLSLLQVPELFLLGAGGVVGWIGGESLSNMAKWLERRTGIRVTDEE